MRRVTWRALKMVLIAVVAALCTVWIMRIVATWSAPPLQRWHTHPPREMAAVQIDRADWTAYLEAEHQVFAQVEREVVERLPEEAKVVANRYYVNSPMYAAGLTQDWNRSFLLEPDGAPQGAVVVLHGLTDSPYSLRHIAQHYRDRGFVAVAIRLPGHGTVPAGLAEAHWQDWRAAARLAVRESQRHIGGGKPLHLVGYSAGAALAIDYCLDALEDDASIRPDRVVLISPMIGVSGYARYAGIAGWPARLPPFARVAWSDIFPEFNPFKYNSFPLNGARQAYVLTRRVQRRLDALAQQQRLDAFPPVLCFQSVTDNTVDAGAVVTALFDKLPENGSEIVLFDVNRTVYFGPLLKPAAIDALERIRPVGPRPYRVAVIGNMRPESTQVVARITAAGEDGESVRPLPFHYPINVFSLSHVALPFPESDALYGADPDPGEHYGIRLGTMALRGERQTLAVSMDMLARVTFNPFFPYLLERIDAGIDAANPNTGSSS